MCKKHNPRKIDKCMEVLIEIINSSKVWKTLSCCCGHGKYPMTIIVTSNQSPIFEVFSNKIIPRKKRFYKKDREGYYFIPEVCSKR